MGYTTRYELSRVVEPVSDADFLTALVALIDDDPFDGDSCKWYEHEKDIVRAMSRCAATVVEVHGEGEEQGDVWDKVFTKADGRITVETYAFDLVRSADPKRTSYAMEKP